MTTILVIYGLLAICLILSLVKSRAKTGKAFKVALKSLMKSLPNLIALVVIGQIMQWVFNKKPEPLLVRAK